MKDVALDACCLINLLAAGCVLSKSGDVEKDPKAPTGDSDSSPLGLVLHVPTVVTDECYYMYQPDPDDPDRLVKSPIDLTPYLAGGILRSCDVEGEMESGLLVNYATRLDDGEAACLAVAKGRGWILATDDRIAARMAIQEGVAVLTTAELMRRWAKRSSATDAAIADVLDGIRRYARFIPRAHSAEAAWWLSHLPPA